MERRASEWASERASDVTDGCNRRMVLAEVYSPCVAKGENRKDGGRLLAPSGEIEYGANFTRDTAIDSLPSSPGFILFRAPLFRRAIRFAQTNERPFFPSFSLIAESETRATVIPFLALVSFSLLPYLRCLYFYSPLSLFFPRHIFVFFFSYWYRFHKYSMADNVPGNCKTSERFRLCRVLCAFELDMAKVDVSLARSLRYP